MTSPEDYIFDTIPYNPEIDLNKLSTIQNELQAGNVLRVEEATILLDWITYNARCYAVSGSENFNIFTNPMIGACAPTQRLNVELLRKFGLDARPFNTADCMGPIPKNYETYRRMENGRESPAVRHSVLIVNIPIKNEDGNVVNYKYLLDPTFRQFCLKKNCVEREEWFEHGYAAPHTGYFMKKENLIGIGVSEEEAQKTEEIGREIISKGYILLTEENSRLYMNAFRRASIDRLNQSISHEINGEEFIKNFENIPMKMHGYNKGNEKEFTRLPSEIIEQDYLENRSVFSRIKDLFKKIFTKNTTKILPSGRGMDKVEIPLHNKYNLQSVVLTEEQEKEFRMGERQVLNMYNENQYQHESQTIVKESAERH